MKNILKKASCLIIAAMSAFCMVSCADIQETTGTKNPGASFQGTSDCGDSRTAHTDYLTFEQFCEQKVTTVVKAKLISVETVDDEVEKYTLKVNEVLHGTAEEIIYMYMYSSNKNVNALREGRKPKTFKESAADINKDDEYLFLFEKVVDTYSHIPLHYSTHGALVINLDDLSESEMYNESLSLHSNGIDINNCTKEEIIEYVCNLVKSNNLKESKVPDTSSLENMVNDAPVILHIKIMAYIEKYTFKTGSYEKWYCEVKDVLKGTLPEGTKSVNIKFVPGTADDMECIALLDGEELFIFTTKDSLRPISEKEEIKGYID